MGMVLEVAGLLLPLNWSGKFSDDLHIETQGGKKIN